jgi:protocatechuate 3,4-dioxygenase beta subunit
MEGERFSRRDVLGLIGAAAVSPFFSCANGESAARVPGSPCIVRPEQTEGPFFVDERLNRSDIRSDPSTGAVSEGVPLTIAFHVSRVDGKACTALEGAVVDLWHTDAVGLYSDVRDMRSDTRGRKFLRGHQLTDTGGIARFTTIFPGWYQGRTVHIHFKIRTNGREFTSQLYFDDAITDEIHARGPYAARGTRTMRNARDGVFRDGGSELLLPITRDDVGYAGTFEIGLRT